VTTKRARATRFPIEARDEGLSVRSSFECEGCDHPSHSNDLIAVRNVPVAVRDDLLAATTFLFVARDDLVAPRRFLITAIGDLLDAKAFLIAAIGKPIAAIGSFEREGWRRPSHSMKLLAPIGKLVAAIRTFLTSIRTLLTSIRSPVTSIG